MPEPLKLDPKLLEYCVSEAEKTYLDAVLQAGSVQAASRALETNRNNIRQAVERVRLRAAKMGYAPEAHMVPRPLRHLSLKEQVPSTAKTEPPSSSGSKRTLSVRPS